MPWIVNSYRQWKLASALLSISTKVNSDCLAPHAQNSQQLYHRLMFTVMRYCFPYASLKKKNLLFVVDWVGLRCSAQALCYCIRASSSRGTQASHCSTFLVEHGLWSPQASVAAAHELSSCGMGA